MPANSGNITGLSQTEARTRLIADGPNELPSQKSRNLLSLLWDTVREPMILLLLACGGLYGYLGEGTDASMLLGSVFVLIGISLYQEHRSEKVLETLKKLSSPRTVVIRDGAQMTVAGREVVADDIILLREGDRVPADAVVLEAVNISVDESLLTGESLPVAKSAWDGKTEPMKPGGEGTPFVFSGTLVVQGHGRAKVTKTGIRTEMGKIGKSLGDLPDEETLLKKETRRIVGIVGSVGIGVCLFVAILYGVFRADWSGGILSGLTLGMSMIPEEFTVVLVLFMTFGAWRLSKYHVLARNSAAIETLGAATVLCVDKTGTLTENRMSVSYLVTGTTVHEKRGAAASLTQEEEMLLRTAVLASQEMPFDPMEKELSTYFKKLGVQGRGQVSLIREYPMTKKFTAITHVWKNLVSNEYLACAKGAPESLLSVSNVSPKERTDLMAIVSRLAAEGTRVIAVAEARLPGDGLPQTPQSLQFHILGLIGFTDPVRSSVSQAVAETYQAGMRVIMITGDYPGTAQYVARQIGMYHTEAVMTGEELGALSDDDLDARINSVTIFARVMPEQKLRIVTALKKRQEIVVMTGDGVNDAPALKAAHIGIAVGGKGTDVAREASDLVLLKDDFPVIVTAVRIGRKIYENIKKAMAYVVAVHIPIGGVALVPALFNLPPILLPAHIAFLELIIDPACSVVFESEHSEQGIMQKPPRGITEHIFNRKTLTISILQGISVLTAVLIIYFYSLSVHADEAVARSLSFTTLILSNILLILTNLSWKRNMIEVIMGDNIALRVVAGGAILLLSAVLMSPDLGKLFHFGRVDIPDLFMAVSAACIGLLWFELLKMVNRRMKFL